MEAPIRSIIAYAGEVLPDDVEFEENSGWMLCDGRLLDRQDPSHAALFDAIGFMWGGNQVHHFNIPDLRGYFLRGVDGRGSNETRDPDNLTRHQSNPGGRSGASVATVQNYATAPPMPRGNQQEPFIAESSGDHTHTLNFEIDASRDVDGAGNTVAFPGVAGHPTTDTGLAGEHRHRVRGGGNRETRPKNAYVTWIVRFK